MIYNNKTIIINKHGMRYIVFYFLLFVLSPFAVLAQMPNDWGAFNQILDAKPYQGKKFRLEGAVKVKAIDSTAHAEIWVRVDRPDKKMGFFYNMMDKPIRSDEWKIYSITGKIDKDAERFNFGGLYNRKGLFYFDDFKLFVEKEKGRMEEVPLANPGFEGDSSAVQNVWNFFQKRYGFVATVTEGEYHTGNKSFLVDGSAFVAPKEYGNNDTAGRYAMVNGIKLYYEIYGQGAPLLLLHGNRASISSFNKQIPELSKHYQVIAVDTRAQGKSTEDGKKFTYELFAEDMIALLDYLKLDSVNLLGWSDGGNIGLIMAMKKPEKIRKMAVMGAVLHNNNTSVKPWVNKFLKKELAGIKDSTDAQVFVKRMIELLMYEPKVDSKDLARITCPVLVMAGSDDVVKEEHTKLIATSIKNGQMLIFPKGNHNEPEERPVRFNKAVLEFLQVAL
jgi:pimeloyl-ACP methyl ester carboxylesterase